MIIMTISLTIIIIITKNILVVTIKWNAIKFMIKNPLDWEKTICPDTLVSAKRNKIFVSYFCKLLLPLHNLLPQCQSSCGCQMTQMWSAICDLTVENTSRCGLSVENTYRSGVGADNTSRTYYQKMHFWRKYTCAHYLSYATLVSSGAILSAVLWHLPCRDIFDGFWALVNTFALMNENELSNNMSCCSAR